MTKINLMENCLDRPCPPMPKEWPGLLDYFIMYILGNVAGFVLIKIYWGTR